MFEWFDALSGFEQVLWYIAVPFSVLFALQLIFVFMGIGDLDDDFDVGPDSDAGVDTADGDDSIPAFKPLTVRNFITFFTIFAWTGITMTRSGYGHVGSIFVSIAVSCIVVLIMVIMMLQMSKMSGSGTMRIENAQGRNGSVYLPIPPERTGEGAVHVVIQGSNRELNAVTDDKRALATGTQIVVIDYLSPKLLLVEAI